MKSVIIFGGSGYVGKNLIRFFSKKGFKIIIPYQKQINEANLRLFGSVGQIIPFHFSSLKNPKLQSLIKEVDVCINLKTSWESNKDKLTKSILDFNKDLLTIINASNIKKFIYFSGLGTENKSTFRNEIIYQTEELISNNFENSFIIRPSVILGNGDQFLSNLIPIFKMSFFIPLFGDGNKKFQPVLIEDVIEFVSKVVEANDLDKKSYDLAGPEIFSYKDFYNHISEIMDKKRVFVPVPFPVMRPLVKIGEKLPFFPLNSEQLSLFETDNILKDNKIGFDYFKISPKKVISAIKKSL